MTTEGFSEIQRHQTESTTETPAAPISRETAQAAGPGVVRPEDNRSDTESTPEAPRNVGATLVRAMTSDHGHDDQVTARISREDRSEVPSDQTEISYPTFSPEAHLLPRRVLATQHAGTSRSETFQMWRTVFEPEQLSAGEVPGTPMWDVSPSGIAVARRAELDQSPDAAHASSPILTTDIARNSAIVPDIVLAFHNAAQGVAGLARLPREASTHDLLTVTDEVRRAAPALASPGSTLHIFGATQERETGAGVVSTVLPEVTIFAEVTGLEHQVSVVHTPAGAAITLETATGRVVAVNPEDPEGRYVYTPPGLPRDDLPAQVEVTGANTDIVNLILREEHETAPFAYPLLDVVADLVPHAPQSGFANIRVDSILERYYEATRGADTPSRYPDTPLGRAHALNDQLSPQSVSMAVEELAVLVHSNHPVLRDLELPSGSDSLMRQLLEARLDRMAMAALNAKEIHAKAAALRDSLTKVTDFYQTVRSRLIARVTPR